MIKDLYSAEDAKKLGNSIRKYAIIIAALLLCAAAVGVATCFSVNDGNASLFKIVNIIVTSLCFCAALYFFFNEIQPMAARKNFIEKMVNSPGRKFRCRVTRRGKTLTSARHIKLTELQVYDENGKEQILYWDMENGEPDFQGHIVEFKLVGNKIVGYGDAQ